jgi:TRAP-type C4-dicarboxylate transport system permease small subunit
MYRPAGKGARMTENKDAFARAVEWLCNTLLYVATSAGILVTAFVTLSSTMRYLFGQPLSYTEELVGLLFATMVYLSLPYCTMHRRHIEVTILTDRFSPAVRRWTDRASALLVLVFCVWYGSFAWDFVALSWRLHSKSDMGQIVLWPWMASMIAACILIGAAMLARWRAGLLQQGQGSSGA